MIVAFAGQKGGAGKTTVAVSVAAELLALGSRVLVADADPQRSARTWAAVAAEQGAMVPACVAVGADMYPEQLPRLAASYDHVVIDCPPRHGEIQRAALMLSDLVVIPCGQSAVEAWALSETAQLVEQAREVRPGLRAMVLLTRVQPRTVLGRGAQEALEALGLGMLKTRLAYRIAYQEALAAGLGVTWYAPRGPAAAELRALTDELLALTAQPRPKPRPKKGR